MRRWFTLFPPQCFVSTWRWLILFPLLWKRRWFTLLPPQSLHGGDSHYSHLYEWGGDSHNSHLYERGGDSHYFHLNVYMEVIHITATSMNEEVIHITFTSMSTWRWFTLLPPLWMRWFTLFPLQCLHRGDSHNSHLYEQGSDSHNFQLNVYMEVIHITSTKERWSHYSKTCPCSHLYSAVTCIKRSNFSCTVIENFIWFEPLSYISTFSLSQRWPFNIGLTILPPLCLWLERWFTSLPSPCIREVDSHNFHLDV
jgi:hypothetical protein